MSTTESTAAVAHPFLSPEILVQRLRAAKTIASFEQLLALESPQHRADAAQFLSRPVTAVRITGDYNLAGHLFCQNDKLVQLNHPNGDTSWAHMHGEHFDREFVPVNQSHTAENSSAVAYQIVSRLFPGRTIDEINKLTADANLRVAFYNPDEHDVHLVPHGHPLNRGLVNKSSEIESLKRTIDARERLCKQIAHAIGDFNTAVNEILS